MAKRILAVTVPAVAQLVSELGQDAEYELSLEASLGTCFIIF